MNWYYADAGQQAGPVDETQFQALIASGKITRDTLVWREGMANWQPYREVAAPGAGVSLGQAVCAECGRSFPVQEMISYGPTKVCASCKPVFLQKLSEGASLQRGTVRYAGFWIRVGAKLIDGIILAVVFMPPLLYFAFKNAQNPTVLPVGQLIVQLLYIIGNAGYTIFFLGKYAATPGKMACGLKVITADGGPVSYGRATGRFFAEMLSGLICYIGYIMVAFDSQKRGLHDHICSTRVIYK
jgi:uncharacterized RDD family membrane protein YckC